MQLNITRPDLYKLKEKLRRVRIASWSAIEQGDCHAVARLTFETARLQDFISSVQRMPA